MTGQGTISAALPSGGERLMLWLLRGSGLHPSSLQWELQEKEVMGNRLLKEALRMISHTPGMQGLPLLPLQDIKSPFCFEHVK